MRGDYRPLHTLELGEGGSGSMTLDAAVGSDGEGALIGGVLSITLTSGSAQVDVSGHFTVRPSQNSGRVSARF
ncbi:MAG: hypothetical protein IJ055_10770 [Oscillospiraceae bacterium]|nr:hypothetical protein [Oscillospiraceae bacterium]